MPHRGRRFDHAPGGSAWHGFQQFAELPIALDQDRLGLFEITRASEASGANTPRIGDLRSFSIVLKLREDRLDRLTACLRWSLTFDNGCAIQP